MSEAIKVYSNALFQLSTEENILDEVNNTLKQCADIFKNEPEFVKLLSSPIITGKEKISMLQSVFKQSINERVFDFMCLLAEKNRINLFCEIQKDFSAQFNEVNNILEAQVITALPLSNELRAKVLSKIERQTGKNVTIVETIDKSILGGIIIKYNNTIIDGSVKNRFNDLKIHIEANRMF